MSEKIDPMEVAKRLEIAFAVNGYDRLPKHFLAINCGDALALARVVLAAVERVKGGHSIDCDRYAWDDEGDPVPLPADRACTCGHDALVATLKGEK